MPPAVSQQSSGAFFIFKANRCPVLMQHEAGRSWARVWDNEEQQPTTNSLLVSEAAEVCVLSVCVAEIQPAVQRELISYLVFCLVFGS